ncbi:MAG: hypothetical protein GPJ52_08770 [Candidatus Heimdallarchaeota archaeon]|nr:hypothetical protein [Candidatus Heimdallarchaeota archaeon]
MSYNKRRLFYLILLGNIIIFCNLLSVKPTSSFVATGDNFHYEYTDSYYQEIESIEYGSSIVDEYTNSYSIDIHIREINSVDETILYERTDEDDVNNFTAHYGWESYISNYFDFTDIFYINYIWNLETDRPILRSFGFDFNCYRFIENNWTSINAHLSDIFNESTIVDTVTNPNDMTEQDLTFGDFLGSLKSYKIQGRSSLPAARQGFTDSTTKWTFKFDLSGVLHYLDHYNTTFGYNVYLPIEKMTHETVVEYTEDGARKHQKYLEELEIIDSAEEYKLTEFSHYEVALGKLPIQLSFSYLASIPAILFIVLVVRIKNKKK